MENSSMPQSVNPAPKPRSALSARRIVLLASAAMLGAGVLISGAQFVPARDASFLASPAYAQTTQRPVGFADIVEKVKPAVISVRVKMRMDAQSTSSDDEMPFPKGSPMEKFFKIMVEPLEFLTGKSKKNISRKIDFHFLKKRERCASLVARTGF